MSVSGEFMKAVCKEMALGFKCEYEETREYIKTFEGIIKDKTLSKTIKNQTKEVLKTLYQQRDEYGKKAEWYRKLYQNKLMKTIKWNKK